MHQWDRNRQYPCKLMCHNDLGVSLSGGAPTRSSSRGDAPVPVPGSRFLQGLPLHAMPRTSTVSVSPIASLLVAMVSVQGGAAVAKGLFPVLGAAGTAGIRIGLSALMLLVAFRPPVARLTRAQWIAVVPYGITLGAMNVLFYLALDRVPLGLAVTLEFVGPLGVAVAHSRRALDLLWVAMAAVGIALIAPWQSHGIDPVGAAFALLAGACWAAYILLGGRLSKVLSGGAAVATGMMVATLTIVPFAISGGGLAHLTWPLLGAGAVVALLSSALPYTCEMHALRTMPSKTFSIFMSLEPALAALAGFVFLGERLAGAQWSSIALVIGASAGAAIAGREPVAAPPLGPA
jgi:inner membrane transporter RhtA